MGALTAAAAFPLFSPVEDGIACFAERSPSSSAAPYHVILLDSCLTDGLH